MAEEPEQILTPDGELGRRAPVGDRGDPTAVPGHGRRPAVRSEVCGAPEAGSTGDVCPHRRAGGRADRSAAAIRRDDWLVATYRDAAALLFHGYPRDLLVLWRSGDERGGRVPDDVFALRPSITVGAHMLHAVGLAWAARLQGLDRIALTQFGDGATSEGDFHEALNFAGVFRCPVVFVCQNNHYAISMSRDRQTASATIAEKAEAYGLPGVLVNGNDLFAVYRETANAAARARTDGVATLIEALTYRLGPHTTSDDPRRYRSDEEQATWRDRDPLERVRRYLQGEGAWDEAWQRETEAVEGGAIEEAVEAAESLPPQEPGDMFGSMFAEFDLCPGDDVPGAPRTLLNNSLRVLAIGP